MQTPLQIDLHHLPASPALEARIRGLGGGARDVLRPHRELPRLRRRAPSGIIARASSSTSASRSDVPGERIVVGGAPDENPAHADPLRRPARCVQGGAPPPRRPRRPPARGAERRMHERRPPQCEQRVFFAQRRESTARFSRACASRGRSRDRERGPESALLIDRATMRTSRRYALLGALAGLLAPGALFLFATVSKRALDPFWLSVLLAVGGTIVFALLGRMIGLRDELLEESLRDRRAHEGRESTSLRPPIEPGAVSNEALRDDERAGHDRPRSLQGNQRSVWSPGGRRDPAPAGGPARFGEARRRSRGPLRRRRVRSHPAAHDPRRRDELGRARPAGPRRQSHRLERRGHRGHRVVWRGRHVVVVGHERAAGRSRRPGALRGETAWRKPRRDDTASRRVQWAS